MNKLLRGLISPFSSSVRYMALLLLLLGRCFAGHSQTPTWQAGIVGSSLQAGGFSQIRATAVDANGNVFVTGFFQGQVTFGNTLLTSRLSTFSLSTYDVFVAKYVPSTNTWAWAQSAGGTAEDYSYGIAVSGNSIYITGSITNNKINGATVLFGGTGSTLGTAVQYGASSSTGAAGDLFVAKYTDNGNSATFRWSQVGGGLGDDVGYGIAVSGSNVYVTGAIYNTLTDTNQVVFGGTGSTLGTMPQYGITNDLTSELLVAKYTDNGSSASFGWTQVGGSLFGDCGYGIAVNGTSVYVTGSVSCNFYNSVYFGGTGTTPGTVIVGGVRGSDLVIAKYTDNGPAATLVWTQTAGGTESDQGRGIAVNGSSLYVTGYISNNQQNSYDVSFANNTLTGTAVVISTDLIIAKYTDNGNSVTNNWAQVGGGAGNDYGYGIAVNGTNLYVAGSVVNNINNTNAVVFGGLGYTQGTVPQAGISSTVSADWVVVKYTDDSPRGTLRWTQAGGDKETDGGHSLAVNGNNVYAGGYVISGTSGFGPASTQILGTTSGAQRALVSQLTDQGTTGSWQRLAGAVNGGSSQTLATALDAAGNVFVTGSFSGQVLFGTTLLSSVGGSDIFVAKYVPSTNTWAWAQSAGGIGGDCGYGIAVSGTNVYVTGVVVNNLANSNNVLFGGTGYPTSTAVQHGASSVTSTDMVLAKYTDNGTSGTLGWTQVGGGRGEDYSFAVAVSGTNVYLAGVIVNNTANANTVVFGGAGTLLGTTVQHGTSPTAGGDLVLVKYTDNGPSATLGWTQVGGGNKDDYGRGIAATNNAVYVTGAINNNRANASAVVFGGSGATPGVIPQYGATSTTSEDIIVAKYLDNGPSATLGWTQVGGGTSSDVGFGVALSGSNVYVTGRITNNTANAAAVVFGGAGVTPGTAPQYGATSTNTEDVFVAKYTDSGSSATLGWTQVGGGNSSDCGYSVATDGSSVYVAGSAYNNMSNSASVVFGGAGTTPGTVPGPRRALYSTITSAIIVAKYTDNGPSATVNWTQGGGGNAGNGVATQNGNVYVVSSMSPPDALGSFYISGPRYFGINFLGILGSTPLSMQAATVTNSLTLYPNPTTGSATLVGAQAGADVRVSDALGRIIYTTRATSSGTAQLMLPSNLSAGVYIVRTKNRTIRLVLQ